MSHFNDIKLVFCIVSGIYAWFVSFVTMAFHSCTQQKLRLIHTFRSRERNKEWATANAKKTMMKMSPDFSSNLLNALLFSKRCQVQLNSIMFPFELVPPFNNFINTWIVCLSVDVGDSKNFSFIFFYFFLIEWIHLHKVDRNKWPYTKVALNGSKRISYKLPVQEHTIIHAVPNSLGNQCIPPPNHLQVECLITFQRFNQIGLCHWNEHKLKWNGSYKKKKRKNHHANNVST